MFPLFFFLVLIEPEHTSLPALCSVLISTPEKPFCYIRNTSKCLVLFPIISFYLQPFKEMRHCHTLLPFFVLVCRDPFFFLFRNVAKLTSVSRKLHKRDQISPFTNIICSIMRSPFPPEGPLTPDLSHRGPGSLHVKRRGNLSKRKQFSEVTLLLLISSFSS